MGTANFKQNKTHIIGRLLRLILGLFFVTEVYPVYRDVTTEGALIRLGWALALVAFYVLLHLIIVKYFQNINMVLGAILAFGPFLSVFFIGYGGPAATGALTFISVSLIIAAVRSDSGCEVMSIPTVFLGKHTHLCCIVFSPIDWIEKGLNNNE
jgi:hypothetical protein